MFRSFNRHREPIPPHAVPVGAISGALLALCIWQLDETLPVSHRQSLHPVTLAKNYWMVFRKLEFQWLGAALAFNFAGLFLYVMSAPIFLIKHLGLNSQQFAWFFVPAVTGKGDAPAP